MYGIEHFGYVLGVTTFGLLFCIIGIAVIVQGSLLVGVLLILVGIIASYAGFVGTMYKVIADGVAKGTEITESTKTARKIYSEDD